MKNTALKISAVSYINAKPFVYGIEHSGLLKDYALSLDTPSVCAEKLIQNKIDIGLAPVVVIPRLKEYFILPDFCIGANGAVRTVMLYSNVPIKDCRKILLDNQSKTSVLLVQILAKHSWKISPEWIAAEEGYERNIKDSTAGIVIGDRNFSLFGKYKFTYDLSEEWKLFTGLPFVFACWIANKELEEGIASAFYKSLQFGLDHRPEVIKSLSAQYNENMISEYLNRYINYSFDSTKKTAMQLFFKLCKNLQGNRLA